MVIKNIQKDTITYKHESAQSKGKPSIIYQSSLISSSCNIMASICQRLTAFSKFHIINSGRIFYQIKDQTKLLLAGPYKVLVCWLLPKCRAEASHEVDLFRIFTLNMKAVRITKYPDISTKRFLSPSNISI